MPSIYVFSGRRPPRPYRASRRARPARRARQWPRPGWDAVVDPLLDFPCLLPQQIELWPSLLVSQLQGGFKGAVLSRQKPRAPSGMGTQIPPLQGRPNPVPCSSGLDFLSVLQNALTGPTSLEVQSAKSSVCGFGDWRGSEGPRVLGECRGRGFEGYSLLYTTFIQLK